MDDSFFSGFGKKKRSKRSKRSKSRKRRRSNKRLPLPAKYNKFFKNKNNNTFLPLVKMSRF